MLRDARIRAYLNQQQEIRHQEAVIAKLKSFNREKSIRRAESREKMLEKIDRLEKPMDIDDSMDIRLEPDVESRNAFPVPGGASGAMTLVYQDAGVPAMLADNIQRNLVETGFRDLGVQERPGLIVLRKTQMPAVLVEVGFIDNPEDNRFFDENFDAIAQAIADGVLETIRQQEAKRPEYYQVQVGAFRTRMPADRLVNELQASGLPAFLVYDDGLYKVRVGAFLNMDYAVQMERNLRNMGYPTVLVRERAIY